MVWNRWPSGRADVSEPEEPGSKTRLGSRRSLLISIEHAEYCVVVCAHSLVLCCAWLVTMALHVHCSLGQLSPLPTSGDDKWVAAKHFGWASRAEKRHPPLYKQTVLTLCSNKWSPTAVHDLVRSPTDLVRLLQFSSFCRLDLIQDRLLRFFHVLRGSGYFDDIRSTHRRRNPDLDVIVRHDPPDVLALLPDDEPVERLRHGQLDCHRK